MPYPISAQNKWPAGQAKDWYAKQEWVIGCNFIPSTAINQLEMWQEETFDTATIDRELGWAASIGFNSMRVFLHNLLWEQDSTGFLKRIDQYLKIANRHGIKTMLVLFDGVWDPYPELGQQPEPKPYIHNSGWVQSPGAEYLQDTTKWPMLEAYVKGIIHHFADDDRVVIWDLFNEADNPNWAYRRKEIKNKSQRAYALLKQTFEWAREVHPSQPLTACVWHGKWAPLNKASDISRLAIEASDIITFHCYEKLKGFSKRVKELTGYDRPLICTEYLARKRGNTFEDILPYLKEQDIGAYNWGLVSGKTQTIYPWKSWVFRKKREPKLWFHDIFRKDGTPFDKGEIRLIKGLTQTK